MPKDRTNRTIVDREQARAIAERHCSEHGLGLGVRRVLAWAEIDARKPLTYGLDLERDHWIAYIETGRPWLGPSTIVAVHQVTGRVIYSGSAFDEG